MDTQLDPRDLRWRCAPEDCAGVPAAAAVIGQDRALAALELGLDIDAPGYNIFVTGEAGSGRSSTVRKVLETARALPRARPFQDLVYVHDFDQPSRPRLLRLPSGDGKRLQHALRELIRALESQIPALFDSEAYRAERERVTRGRREQHQRLFEDFQKRLAGEGYSMVSLEQGPISTVDIAALVDGQPMPVAALDNDRRAAASFADTRARAAGLPGLPDREPQREEAIKQAVAAAGRRHEELNRELSNVFREGRRIIRELNRELLEVEGRMARRLVADLVDDLATDFPLPELRAHLERLTEHVLENLALFAAADSTEGEEEDEPVSFRETDRSTRGALAIYGVNVVLDTTGLGARPVVIEPNPTFIKIFGTIEHEGEREAQPRLDFLSIRTGALLRAQGGFLVLYARDVLLEPGVWRTLVRALRSRQLEIQAPEHALYLLPSAVKPEPIPLEVKVVLLGDEETWQLLTALEDDFPKVFKIKAEFDDGIAADRAGVRALASALQAVGVQEGLRPAAPAALARAVEHAARRARAPRRLSTHLGELADALREADHYTRARGGAEISAADVEAALAAARSRHDLLDEHLARALREGLILIDTSGARVAQVNGLAVLGLGRHDIGAPLRVTASVGPGAGALVSVERESRLSGPLHDKGVLILAGYLRGKYGADQPLALNASLAFEQSYGVVEGDSASLAELCALLSALSAIPARQSVALTGSVNQHGDVQAVGGVDEKIEGFFRLCAERGLSGDQGCIIPEANARGLMLEPAVVAAAAAGRFAVHAVREVDQALPIVFGVPAEALHERVRARLRAFSPQEPVVQRWVRIDGAPAARAPRGPTEPTVPTPGA